MATAAPPRPYTVSELLAEVGGTLRSSWRDVAVTGEIGRWEGEVRYDGKTVPIDATRVYGTKDRSWGVRPVGEATPAAPEPTTMTSYGSVVRAFSESNSE